MSYDIHLRRSKIRSKDDKPITLTEIENSLGTLPPGFSVDRSEVVTIKTPQDETISIEVGEYLIYENPDDESDQVCIYFTPRSPRFSVSDERSMLPIIELADKMNFIVQGDEGEIYTKESVMKGIDTE
jgi:hypothetical protein